MKQIFKTKISSHSIIGLAIMLSLPLFLMTSCGADNSSGNITLVDSSKASFKIQGTWVSADDPAKKAVFTADSLTEIIGDNAPLTHAYKWINEQEIEVVSSKSGEVVKSKITIDGDNLTLIRGDKEQKLIREGAISNNAPVNNDPVNTHLTPGQKVFKDKLTGTWIESSPAYRLVFTRDGRLVAYNYNDSVNIQYQSYYRITGDSTVEWNGEGFIYFKYNMSFSEDNKKMIWISMSGARYPLAHLSENADADFSASLRNNIKGNWVGIAGTASADERLSVVNGWSISVRGGAFNNGSYYSITPDETVSVNGKVYKVSIEKDVLTMEENGVVKKYNRLKEIVSK